MTFETGVPVVANCLCAEDGLRVWRGHQGASYKDEEVSGGGIWESEAIAEVHEAAKYTWLTEKGTADAHNEFCLASGLLVWEHCEETQKVVQGHAEREGQGVAGEDVKDRDGWGWMKKMLVLAIAVKKAGELENQWDLKLEWDAVDIVRVGIFGNLKLENGKIDEESIGVFA